MERVMMKCGHVAQSKINGKPVCVICLGLTPDAEIVAETEPDLTDRKARCPYCGEIVDSNKNLPFFEYCPDQEYDRFYCGCRGWD